MSLAFGGSDKRQVCERSATGVGEERRRGRAPRCLNQLSPANITLRNKQKSSLTPNPDVQAFSEARTFMLKNDNVQVAKNE